MKGQFVRRRADERRAPMVIGLAVVAGLSVSIACRGEGGGGNAAPRPAADPPALRLRVDSVVALLDVLDVVVARRPDAASERSALLALAPDARSARLAELSASNAADPAVGAAIDAFVGTAARRIYLRRFPNVGEDDVRRALTGLPWAAVDAPGDIARPWFDAIPIRDRLREWVLDLGARVDLARARDAAARWLPPAGDAVPEMFLVYDGNAGSYAAEGKAFFNLYSEVVRDLPPGELPGSERIDDIERVIAHEMQHVLAERFFDDEDDGGPVTHTDWRRDAVAGLVRGMVGEGVATHCNPPTGVRREVWEDPLTIRALIAELSSTLRALRDGTMDEPHFRAWYRDSFHALPRRLLREHLLRAGVDDRIDDELVRDLPHRPDLLHALGWWMTGRISGALPRPADAPGTIGPADPATTRALILDPQSLFVRYAAALGPDEADQAVEAPVDPGRGDAPR